MNDRTGEAPGADDTDPRQAWPADAGTLIAEAGHLVALEAPAALASAIAAVS